MATDVILPALGMAQETGKIVQWLKAEGEQIAKGEPLAEIETDKATVEIEAPANGILAHVSAIAGAEVPVGQVIATILTPGEASSDDTAQRPQTIVASPLASRMADEHNVDLSLVKPTGRRVQKADVLAYLQNHNPAMSTPATSHLVMASPKARRLANEQGKNLASLTGTGPGGAVLAADVFAAVGQTAPSPANVTPTETGATFASKSNNLTVNNIWQIMAERTAQSWTSSPHFYLVREVNVSSLIAWRTHILRRSVEKVTYTDLLVKIIAAALHIHPRINTSWNYGKINLMQEINIGLAVAVDNGLVVPVIHQADTLGLNEITRQRKELVAKAQAGQLRPQDISGGTFTISNLGMYDIDAFNAIINQPQAAILAVGRITERVVPVNGQPGVQPMMVLTLSCDHRVVDGARGAQFLRTITNLIEEPLGLLDELGK